jgi:DNA damage-binding protein 1
LGVIDDIQKLHVTTCRLGMAPRRIVHCADGRMFAVGCIESGIKQLGLGGDEQNMGNCIRFLDDTTFDDIER